MVSGSGPPVIATVISAATALPAIMVPKHPAAAAAVNLVHALMMSSLFILL
jgi:hypothetical protein